MHTNTYSCTHARGHTHTQTYICTQRNSCSSFRKTRQKKTRKDISEEKLSVLEGVTFIPPGFKSEVFISPKQSYESWKKVPNTS